MRVSMMRYFSVTDERTNEPTNKAILGVGYRNRILQDSYMNYKKYTNIGISVEIEKPMSSDACSEKFPRC